MRIGFFSDSYYPYISGVVRSIDLFSRELRALGHEVYIFAPDYPDCDDDPYVYRFSSVPTPNAPGFRIPIPLMPNITEKMRSLNLDIIHTHSPFLMGRLASALARRLSLPLTFTYHTKYEEYVHYVPFARKTAKRITIKLTRDFCKKCDMVITPTAHVQEMLKEDGIETPMEVVPTGVDIKKYGDGSSTWMRRRYRFNNEDLILLYVGRLGEEKNLFFLLGVVKELMAEFPDLYLMLVGGGPDEKEFRRVVVDWDLEHRIIFAGVVNPQKVIDYYLGADIFSFPSVTETQGLVILEAMAAGLPVIAMDREGPASIVNNGVDGILVQPEKENFLEGLRFLVENEDKRQEMRGNAFKKAEQYSCVQMAKRLEGIYNKLLESKGGQSKEQGSQA